jgi:hypothetical protein
MPFGSFAVTCSTAGSRSSSSFKGSFTPGENVRFTSTSRNPFRDSVNTWAPGSSTISNELDGDTAPGPGAASPAKNAPPGPGSSGRPSTAIPASAGSITTARCTSSPSISWR